MIDQTSARERRENFMSYLKLFAFLIIAGVAGYYVYQRVIVPKAGMTTTVTPEGVVTELVIPPNLQTTKPSQLLAPMMAKNLPLLYNDFSEEPAALLPDFAAVETAVATQKASPGKLQPAWNIAGRLCTEIQNTLADRNKSAAASAAQLKGNEVVSVVPRSKVETNERASKTEFFKKSAQLRWNNSVPQRKQKIEALYRQLLTAEAQAEL